MQLPKITVAIPTYQREEVLVSTIKEVFNQNFDRFECIVVDQSEEHTEETQAFLDHLSDNRFRYYKVSPPSLPAARNFAVKKSKSDILLFIDDDVELSEKFIESHYNLHTSCPDIKAVAGRIQMKGKEPSDKLFYFNWIGFERQSFDCPVPQESTAFQGCNFSVKKEIFKEIEMFDTNYKGSAIREESDLAYRIRKAGYTIWYEPNACLFHLVASTGGCRISLEPKDDLSFYENDLYYTLKTVKPILLPIVLAIKLFWYVKKKSIYVMLRRLPLFLKGLRTAIQRTYKPNKIEVEILKKSSVMSTTNVGQASDEWVGVE